MDGFSILRTTTIGLSRIQSEEMKQENFMGMNRPEDEFMENKNGY